jgi:hypothetical protein
MLPPLDKSLEAHNPLLLLLLHPLLAQLPPPVHLQPDKPKPLRLLLQVKRLFWFMKLTCEGQGTSGTPIISDGHRSVVPSVVLSFVLLLINRLL